MSELKTAAPGASPVPETCPSCGGTIAERHCPACGELRPSARAYSLRDFFHEAFEVVTNVERSLLQTLRALFLKPGRLTQAYMRGERVRFLKPLQLFLLVNVAFFVWAGWARVHVFTTPLGSHLGGNPYRAYARAATREAIAARGITLEAYAPLFDAKGAVLARTLIIALVPLFAAALAVVHARKRGPVVRHVVFSTHFMAFVLVLTMVVAVVLNGADFVLGLFAARMPWATRESLAGWLMAAGTLTWLTKGYRLAYGDGRGPAIAKAAASVLTLALLLVLYRFLLFVATTWLL